MKITFQSNEKKQVTLFLPTRLICSKWMLKLMLKHLDEMNHFQNMDIWIKPLYRYLKNYVKQNGHFILMEVETASGCYVLVQI